MTPDKLTEIDQLRLHVENDLSPPCMDSLLHEIDANASELREAREIIGAFYTQVSIEGQRHFPHALTTRARAFINRENKSDD